MCGFLQLTPSYPINSWLQTLENVKSQAAVLKLHINTIILNLDFEKYKTQVKIGVSVVGTTVFLGTATALAVSSPHSHAATVISSVSSGLLSLAAIVTVLYLAKQSIRVSQICEFKEELLKDLGDDQDFENNLLKLARQYEEILKRRGQASEKTLEPT